MADDKVNSHLKSMAGQFIDRDVLSNTSEVRDLYKEILDLQEKMSRANKHNLDVDKFSVFNLRENLALKKQILENIDKEKSKLKMAEERHRNAMASGNTSKAKQIADIIRDRKLNIEGMEAELGYMRSMSAIGLLPLLLLGKKILDVFLETDKAAADFRREVGLTRDSAKGLRKMAEETAIEFMHLGVTFDSAYKSITAIGNAVGNLHAVSKGLVETTSIFNAQFGIAADDSVLFMKNMAAISKSTIESQQNMLYLAGYMSAAAGVPLNQIMKDVATKSGTTLSLISRIPAQVIKTAIELRKMGSSLDEAAKANRELLNFTDNINSEMEASVLLGRSINLQKARELTYHRNIEAATKEILKQAREINFENLDVFQQEAFAKATGRSVEELQRMLQTQNELKKARYSSDPQVKEMVRKYDAMRNSSNAILMSETERYKIQLRTLSNQSRQEAIQAKWNQLISKVAYIFLPAIDRVLGFVIDHFDTIAKISAVIGTIWLANKILMMDVTKIGFNLGTMLMRVASASTSILGALRIALTWTVTSLAGIFTTVVSVAETIGAFIMSIPALAVTIAFGVGVAIGYLLNKFEFVQKTFTDLFLSFFNIIDGFKVSFVDGLKAIGIALFKSLTLPFTLAWNAISSWMGHSPSQLGLAIVKGIVSVQSLLFDALIYPFKHAWNWISKTLGFGGVSADTKISKSVVSDSTVNMVSKLPENPSTSTTNTAANNTTAANKTDVGITTLQDILGAIKTLNSNLESGKIGIYIDGQLLSATLARQTEFRNGYGVNVS